MYRSLRPIYDKLFQVLNENFGPDAVNPDLDDFKLKRFDRGFFHQSGTTPTREYPLAFLEWGRVSDVELFQSPEEYAYVVTYRLFYFIQTGGNPLQIANQVFREIDDAGDPIDARSPVGVGEFAQTVCNFFWQTHHASRFSVAWEDQDDWSILDLTLDASIIAFSTVTDVTLLSIRNFLEQDESFRGIQVNFSFRVREREGFA